MTLQEIQYKAQSIISKWRDDDSAPYIEFVEELAHMIVPEPSEYLEEAAEEYRKRVCEHPMYYTYTKQCFIAGAKCQKEQMLKEAVDAEVIVPIYEGKYEGNDIWSAEIKIPGRYEVGDKVRVIVIPNTDKK